MIFVLINFDSPLALGPNIDTANSYLKLRGKMRTSVSEILDKKTPEEKFTVGVVFQISGVGCKLDQPQIFKQQKNSYNST